jgi:hypothetical protein
MVWILRMLTRISPKINYSYQKNKSWFIGAKIDWKYLAFIRLFAKDYKRKIIEL